MKYSGALAKYLVNRKLMSGIGGTLALEVKNKAIGLLLAGKTQREVAKRFKVTTRTVKRWWRKEKHGESQKDKQRSGRPKKLTRVAKIVIAKSLAKKRQTARKLAARLSAKGHVCSKATVHRYLTKDLGARAYRRPIVPKLSPLNISQRLNFCKDHKKWKDEDWKNVLFSDESPFELGHPPNRKNSVIYAKDREDVAPVPKSKFSEKLMVWGMIGPWGVSELHVAPPGTRIDATYYREIILKEYMLPAIGKRANRGSILKKNMAPDMSRAIFQQDGARCHTAAVNEEWLREHVDNYWAKGVWPANSPDLSPIENVWAILQNKVDEVDPPPSTLTALEKILKDAWSEISPEVLENLYKSMPGRVQAVLESKGCNVIK